MRRRRGVISSLGSGVTPSTPGDFTLTKEHLMIESPGVRLHAVALTGALDGSCRGRLPSPRARRVPRRHIARAEKATSRARAPRRPAHRGSLRAGRGRVYTLRDSTRHGQRRSPQAHESCPKLSCRRQLRPQSSAPPLVPPGVARSASGRGAGRVSLPLEPPAPLSGVEVESTRGLPATGSRGRYHADGAPRHRYRTKRPRNRVVNFTPSRRRRPGRGAPRPVSLTSRSRGRRHLRLTCAPPQRLSRPRHARSPSPAARNPPRSDTGGAAPFRRPRARHLE